MTLTPEHPNTRTLPYFITFAPSEFFRMKLTEVTEKKTEKKFLEVPRILYRDDPNWVCPLDVEIRSIFNEEKNDYFRKGEAIRWILEDDNGALIGRIAAFYNTEKAAKYKQPTGGIGFFECINDKGAAFTLLEAGRSWLESRGMEAMDGPVNFGENDTYWGLLVEGFTPPAFGVNYNFPYYKELLEAYGFKPFFEQTTRHLDITVPFPERFWKIAEWVMNKPGLSFRHFKLDEAEKFADDIIKVYNEAWVHHEHFSPLNRQIIMRQIETAKPILEEDFIWFAYSEDEPIGFLVMFPDVNQIFKHFNGKLNLVNKLRFLYMKRRKKMTRTRITILGVSPKYQRSGIESAIFWHLQEPVLNKRPHINEIEISWVGDFNPRMMSLLEAMNAKPGKKHVTYRKLFKDTGEEQKAEKVVPEQ
jgi:hypothetical protein